MPYYIQLVCWSQSLLLPLSTSKCRMELFQVMKIALLGPPPPENSTDKYLKQSSEYNQEMSQSKTKDQQNHYEKETQNTNNYMTAITQLK